MLKMANAGFSGSAFVPQKFTPDLYEEFILRIVGAHAAGATMRLGQVGRIRYKEHGVPVVDCDFDMMHYYNELKKGDVEHVGSETGAGSALAYSVFIPRHFDDGNVHLVTPADEPSFQLDYYPSAVAGVSAATTIQLSGRPRKAGVQKYRLKFTQRDFVFGGSSNPLETIREENILGLYFDRRGDGPNAPDTLAQAATVDAAWTELMVKKDGKVIVDETVGALQAASNAENRIEALHSRMFEVRLVDPAVDITEALGDVYDVQFRVTGAVTVRCLIVSADFTEDKYDTTVRGSAEVLKQGLDRKTADGKLRPVRIAERLLNLS